MGEDVDEIDSRCFIDSYSASDLSGIGNGGVACGKEE
jgi:hypothetical protein